MHGIEFDIQKIKVKPLLVAAGLIGVLSVSTFAGGRTSVERQEASEVPTLIASLDAVDTSPLESPKVAQRVTELALEAHLSEKAYEQSRREAPMIVATRSSLEPSVSTVNAIHIAGLDRMLLQGKMIPAVLETGVQSDLPGMIRALVSEAIYSEDGTNILIPRGSRLIGQYGNQVGETQTRLFVAWDRLIRPDGISVALASPGTGKMGLSGLPGEVDTHFWARFGEAALMSVLGAGTAMMNVGSSDQQNSKDAYRESISDALNLSAGESLNRKQKIPATISIEAGAQIHVFVAKDLNFTGVVG